MAERMKAAALSATKGLSRIQAERAAANATRNVNAYGQKEEGPSRWQEKKEAKTQMYLKSTEKQATLNQKRCQKCRQTGHWTYECQKPAPENPKPELGGVGIIEKKEKGEKGLKKKKKEKSSKHRNRKRRHKSGSTSESSDSEYSESDQEDGKSRRKRRRHSRRSNGDR